MTDPRPPIHQGTAKTAHDGAELVHDVGITAMSRRSALTVAAGVLGGVVMGGRTIDGLAQQTPPATAPSTGSTPTVASVIPAAPLDASVVPGMASGPLSIRSPFETPALTPVGVTTGSSLTPLQTVLGAITPSDLHFQRHHNGIAVIDPARYELTIHGLVDRPTVLSLEDLKRFPSVTRTYFIECSGNGRSAYRAPKREMTPQDVDGLTSNSEWTGVTVAALWKEAGGQRGASWVLAEGGDAARLSRSIPLAKMLDDAIIAYAQNGEPVRMPNGYPARLLLPGYEGNMCIKWIRRLKAIDQPNMSRDETSKYTDPLPNGTARQFSFVMDAKSIITSPAYPSRLDGPGWWPVSGLAWTGRGRITRVDVSTDGGQHWTVAELVNPVLPMAHVRFRHMWKWDGKPAQLMSRAIDETGYVQPTLETFRRVRGVGTDFHFNAIRTWLVKEDGRVYFGG
ncbi:MAG: sulfite dehydrogenase [Gemmatimonadaceae bacterium]